MAKDLEILAAPSVDPQIWKHELQHTDGQGGGQLSITNLSAGIKFKKGALINFNFTTKEVNPVKNALVVAGGSTSAPRVTKKHLFKVGDFVYVSGDAVTINAIDTSNAAYDVLTLSAACTGATAGAYLEQASVAGGAIAAVKGVYTMTISTRPAAGDKFSLDGIEYVYAAAEGEGVYAIGADAKAAAANVEDAVSAQYDGIFSVQANNGKLIFTQLVGGIGNIPVLVVTPVESTGTLAAAIVQTTAGILASSPSPKFLANAINGESKYDVRGGERITPVLWIFQLIKKSALPYEVSPARLADLSGFKFA